MPNVDQLEIIRASGEIEFYNLDPVKGITNIGRHPDNDIVIDSPGVAPFHAVLDHRQKPYQLVVLNQDGQTILRQAQDASRSQQILPANISTPLYGWDNLEFDGHTVILIDGGAPIVSPAVGLPPRELTPTIPLPARPGPLPPPVTRPEQSGLIVTPAAPTQLSSLPPDQIDDVILTEVGDREQTVMVEQIAAYQMTIVNGGDIVAMFQVSVEGVPAEWVEITPPAVNLNEGQRAAVTVTVRPPRHSTSRAGPHYLALVVTSPNYPGRYSQRGVVLNIEPYHEFMMGELSPKRQSISWFTKSGKARIAITNRGNGNAPFRIAGEDDERGCSFEFDVPGEPVGLARQADLTISPNETVYIPIEITPNKRRLIGLRKRTYAFTITTTLLEGQQTPRSLLGELGTGPLFGPLTILLAILLLLSLTIYFFWPEVGVIAHPRSVVAGQEITLSWRAFPPFFVTIRLNDENVEVPRGSRQDRPVKTTAYVVTADTWLSQIFPFFMGRDEIRVEVTPVRPEIGLFRAEPREIGPGKSTVLSWFVVGADEMKLINASSGVENEIINPAGSLRLSPEEDVTFVLEARNNSLPDNPVRQSVEVRVTTPTPAPLLPPVIERFIVQPQMITPGQTVILQWAVSGVDKVSLQPIGDGLPPISPPIAHMPQETTLYVLSATNGQETVNAVQQVVVSQAPTPTPTPPPGQPPVVEFFGVTPEEWVRVEPDRGDNANEITAQLNWVVTGVTTNVEITGGPPGFEKLSNLPRVGDASLKVRDTTVFVLTAFNDQETAVKTAQIKFLDPTPTPEGSGNGDGGGNGGGNGAAAPEIVAFTAEGVSAADQVTPLGGSPPTYEVVAGSNVNLVWAVNNADRVTLVGVGEQPPAGTYIVSNVVSNRTFQLTATGAGGNTQAFLLLRVVARPAPPPPFSVDGIPNTPTANDITLTWEHAAENEIIGFRIYRALSAGGPFTRVADESQLPSGARLWIDANALPGCRAYYVTAVYTDPISGSRLETSPSANSWFGPGC